MKVLDHLHDVILHEMMGEFMYERGRKPTHEEYMRLAYRVKQAALSKYLELHTEEAWKLLQSVS